MHQIAKNPHDVQQFNTWAKSKRLRTWADFSPGLKTAYEMVREHIAITEQQNLSADTEKPLGAAIHIDHFRKRSLYPALTFDYSNFLVDDLDNNYGACFKDAQPGVTQATFDGAGSIFCPVSENMADFIDFTFDGHMKPKDGIDKTTAARVDETVRLFNLNHEVLKNKRADIIRAIMACRAGGLSDDDIRNSFSEVGFPSVINWTLRLPV